MSTVIATFDLGEIGQFQPHAKYHHGLDMVVYLAESCSYCSEPVDDFLTLLWHPNGERLAGVKLKGFRHAFLRFKERLGWPEDSWLPLVDVIESHLASGWGDQIMREEERKRKYDLARRCVAQIGLTPSEAKEIARAAA